MAIAPDTVSWEREQDLRQYLHTAGRETISSRGRASMENRPP